MDKRRTSVNPPRNDSATGSAAACGAVAVGRGERPRTNAGRRKRSRKALDRELLRLYQRYGGGEILPRMAALAELLEAAHRRIRRENGDGTRDAGRAGKDGARHRDG